MGWEGRPSVVCLGLNVLLRTISRESPGSLCWSWELKFWVSMKTLHLARASNIKLAGNQSMKKHEGNREWILDSESCHYPSVPWRLAPRREKPWLTAQSKSQPQTSMNPAWNAILGLTPGDLHISGKALQWCVESRLGVMVPCYGRSRLCLPLSWSHLSGGGQISKLVWPHTKDVHSKAPAAHSKMK